MIIQFNEMTPEQKKEYLRAGIIISFIPFVNFLCAFLFDSFLLAENYRWWHFSFGFSKYAYKDKKKRWVSFGSVSFLMICAFALVALTDLTGYPLLGIMGYLFPVILTLPLFLYDWHKYVVKGEPWPRNKGENKMNELNTQTTLEESVTAKGIAFGIVGFVVSIVSLPMCLLAFAASLSGSIFTAVAMAAFAIVALVFCGIAKKEGNKSKIVVLGEIFGFISAGICGVSFVISIYTMMVYYLV